MSEEKYNKLDENQLIFRQIDRISRLLTRELSSTSKGSWDVLVESFAMAVKNLESQLSALLDEEYEEGKKRAKKEYRKENSDREFIFGKRDYYNRVFAELLKVLHRNNIWFEESSDFVIDDTGDSK